MLTRRPPSAGRPLREVSILEQQKGSIPHPNVVSIVMTAPCRVHRQGPRHLGAVAGDDGRGPGHRNWPGTDGGRMHRPLHMGSRRCFARAL
jgi:hypothetical protein